MIKIVTADGITVEADSFNKAVMQLRDQQWQAPTLKRDYREEVADRVLDETGTSIRSNTSENFIRDLADLGLLRLVDDGASDGGSGGHPPVARTTPPQES